LATVLSVVLSFGHCVVCPFCWPLCCLSFELWILITPLASSNSSYVTFHNKIRSY
jgi:hypothetical protein